MRQSILDLTLEQERDHWREMALSLRKAFTAPDWYEPIPGFTRLEGRILRLLTKRKFVTFEQMCVALRNGPLDDGPTLGSVKTMVSRCRTKIKKAGAEVEIKCVWSNGWQADQPALRRFLAQQQKGGSDVVPSS